MQLVIVLSCGFDNANMAQSCLFVRLSCNNFLTLCHNLLSFADFKGQNVTSCCYISSFTRIHWPAGRNFVYLKRLRKCGKLNSDDMKELMLMIAVAAVLVSCSGGAAAEKDGDHGIPVKVMTVSQSDNSLSRGYVGTAAAGKSAFLSCRYPGRLVRLNVSAGEQVQAGDVLAEVESQSVISSYEIAHSMLRQAEDGYERARQVYESGGMADVKMVEVEAKLAQARASAAAADAALEDCRVKAPFSGVIGDVLVDEGVELDALDQIVRILDISSVEIRFPVPENELGKISKGAGASVSIPALDVENAEAVITSKGIVASPLSHTYECVLRPVAKIPGLMPGMVAKVHIGSSTGSGVVIPASVIRTDVDGRYVWTVSDDHTVNKTYVVPGGFSGQGILITEGLSDGDRIITEGVQKVCTGLKVRIVE